MAGGTNVQQMREKLGSQTLERRIPINSSHGRLPTDGETSPTTNPRSPVTGGFKIVNLRPESLVRHIGKIQDKEIKVDGTKSKAPPVTDGKPEKRKLPHRPGPATLPRPVGNSSPPGTSPRSPKSPNGIHTSNAHTEPAVKLREPPPRKTKPGVPAPEVNQTIQLTDGRQIKFNDLPKELTCVSGVRYVRESLPKQDTKDVRQPGRPPHIKLENNQKRKSAVEEEDQILQIYDDIVSSDSVTSDSVTSGTFELEKGRRSMLRTDRDSIADTYASVDESAARRSTIKSYRSTMSEDDPINIYDDTAG